jgi:uncharacterized membrane protein (UPF0127 family)
MTRPARVALAALACAAWLGCPQTGDPGLPRGRVTIAGQTVEVEVARTPEARQQGLSGRERLEPGTGMLFLHGDPGIHFYWMKDMNFAIDMVWIRDDRIVEVTHDARPAPRDRADADLALYAARKPYDKVLEVPAGYARAHGFEAGATVAIELEDDRPPL